MWGLVWVAVLGGLAWCWFCPFTLEERWPTGALRAKLRVRRDWQGELYTAGEQILWHANGQMAARGKSFGQRPGSGDWQQARYWDRDGRERSQIDWLLVEKLHQLGRSTDIDDPIGLLRGSPAVREPAAP